MPGIVLRKNGFVPLGVTLGIEIFGGGTLSRASAGTDLPGRADVKFLLKNSLLKVKHLQLRKSFSSTSRGYFLHGFAGLGLGLFSAL